MTEIAYREALPDSEAYFRLFSSTGWNDEYGMTAAELARAIATSWYAVSAYDGDELVGFGRIIADGVHHALIADLIVLPTYQRQGIGSAILQRLLAHCHAHHIHDIQLFCARGKEGFYRRHGFVPRPAEAPGMEWKGNRDE